jgi:hypothetical protein
MLNGTYNPGQLVVVREILSSAPAYDTAVFTGNLSDYGITINGNVVTVTDSVVDRDGSDRLVNVERLQFADTVFNLRPDLNADPVGSLTVDNTAPAVGDFLQVSIADVRDADNVTGTNPAGTVTGTVAYTWQVERVPGTGLFEDIVDLRGDLAFQSANGARFRVTPDLDGLVLRVKAVYIDAHGVAETVFSGATAAVVAGVTPPVDAGAAPPDVTEGGAGVHLIRSDLDFILKQIKIAEAHAAGEDLLSLVPNVRAAAGLRTVTGEFNNLVDFGGIDQSQFGAADNLFPRLLDPIYRNEQDGDTMAFGPPGAPGVPPPVTNTNYAAPGDVADADPRTISNLIVDQTNRNPAVVAAFGGNDGAEVVLSPGFDGIFGTADDVTVNFLPNIAPDAGLSAPFNAWMTFFGQFFDHGLDLVTKGGNGVIWIPLQPDDPLYNPASPQTNFMVLTRATTFAGPGADGVIGTADDTVEQENTTSPFVDQNQTYSSHPSHQVFLRSYTLDADGAHNTGKLIENRDLGADGLFGTGDDAPIGAWRPGQS